MDPLALAGVIGTWVAVGLALVALVGIVGPLLLLREKQSERYKALNSIDSQNTGYTRNGLKLRGKDSFFLKVNVPLLEDPPNPERNFHETNLLKHYDDSRLQKVSSKTGWVNLATIIDAYTSDLPKGDVLVIHQKQSWLPVHRFWLLAFGLFGRYSDRKDHGKRLDENNASRLMIEDEDDENDGWEISPTAGKLYGTTGIIWWRRKLDELDMSTDEAYFVPHSEDYAQTIYPDPIPLSQLFWLALGCLPLGSSKDNIVFDLADYKLNDNSRPLGPQHPTQGFYKFKARGPLGISEVHRKWAKAMGINLKKVYCIQQVDFPSDWETAVANANLNKGPWFRLRDYEDNYLWRSDVHRQILGLLHMHFGPKGALFDHSRYGPSVFEAAEDKVFGLLERMHKVSCLSNLSVNEKDILRRLRELWWSVEPMPSRLFWTIHNAFSRKEAQASYDFGIVHQGRQVRPPSWIQDIVGILTLTSDSFFDTLLLDQPDAPFLKIETATNCVKTKSKSGTLMEHTIDFSEVFANCLPENLPTQTRYLDQTNILLSALSACVRASCFRSLLDSTKLIQLIQRMDEVVYVAASSRIPVLQDTASTRSLDNVRRMAIDERRAAAITPQDDFDRELEEDDDTISNGSVQSSLLRRLPSPPPVFPPSPPPILPGSKEAMRMFGRSPGANGRAASPLQGP